MVFSSHLLAGLYEVKVCHLIPLVRVRVIKIIQILCLGQFLSKYKQGIVASYFAYTYIWGRQTETCEPYLMLIFIHGSLHLEKNIKLLRLG